MDTETSIRATSDDTLSRGATDAFISKTCPDSLSGPRPEHRTQDEQQHRRTGRQSTNYHVVCQTKLNLATSADLLLGEVAARRCSNRRQDSFQILKMGTLHVTSRPAVRRRDDERQQPAEKPEPEFNVTSETKAFGRLIWRQLGRVFDEL